MEDFASDTFEEPSSLTEFSSDKKEKRRKQTRLASQRHRRKKQEEKLFIIQRVKEINNQLQLLAQSPEEECAALVIFASEEEFNATIAQKQEAIHQLRSKNQRVAQLLRSAPSTMMRSSLASTLNSTMSSMNPSEPMRDVSIDSDFTTFHELAAQSIQQLTAFGPNPDVSTELVYNLGWKVKLWPVNACMHALGVHSYDLNVEHVMNATWELLTLSSLEKFRNIFPEVCFLRILQRVTDDLVVIQRLASVPSDVGSREFISLAFRQRIGSSYVIGLKSLPPAMLQQAVTPRCIRGEELRGWIFSPNTNLDEPEWPWNVRQISVYDVKGDGNKLLWDELANDAIANMHRWEIETRD